MSLGSRVSSFENAADVGPDVTFITQWSGHSVWGTTCAVTLHRCACGYVAGTLSPKHNSPENEAMEMAFIKYDSPESKIHTRTHAIAHAHIHTYIHTYIHISVA